MPPKILQIKNNIGKVGKRDHEGNIKKMERQINRLEREAPHQQNGQRIVQGMLKAGSQSHVHIVMSRRDVSIPFSCHQGANTSIRIGVERKDGQKRIWIGTNFLIGQKRLLIRPLITKEAFSEKYSARKEFINNPKMYFNSLLRLPTNEKAIAFKIIRETGLPIMGSIPINKAQMALKFSINLGKGRGGHQIKFHRNLKEGYGSSTILLW